MDVIQLRVAVVEDAEALAAVLRQAFAPFESLYTSAGFAATTPTAGQIRGRWNEGPVWVAGADRIVGTVAAVAKQDSLYVRSMAVLPTARGQDLGRSLLREAESYALSLHCRRLFLSTTPFLAAAIRLYERFGFRRSDAGPRDISGTPLFTMEKPLNQ